jgi:hypothetical protein
MEKKFEKVQAAFTHMTELNSIRDESGKIVGHRALLRPPFALAFYEEMARLRAAHNARLFRESQFSAEKLAKLVRTEITEDEHYHPVKDEPVFFNLGKKVERETVYAGYRSTPEERENMLSAAKTFLEHLEAYGRIEQGTPDEARRRFTGERAPRQRASPGLPTRFAARPATSRKRAFRSR